MCVFNDYIRLQDELKEMQKEIINVSKNYNNELKLFQKGNIIDSDNAEKVKQKYDALQNANEMITSKQTEIERTEKIIMEYLTATNGMAIRFTNNKNGMRQPLIFEMIIDTYGEPKVQMGVEN
jgi:hypothetical protein